MMPSNRNRFAEECMHHVTISLLLVFCVAHSLPRTQHMVPRSDAKANPYGARRVCGTVYCLHLNVKPV